MWRSRCVTEVQISILLHRHGFFFFFSSRRRHTRYWRDWSSDVCSSDLEDEINERLDKIMSGALQRIWNMADQHKITLRTAAFAVACERILSAREVRGVYP